MAMAQRDAMVEQPQQAEQPKQTAATSSKIAKGTVTDPNGGETLIGVVVEVKGTKSGVVTDFDGNFELKIPDGIDKPVLVFSYVGKKSKEVPYTGAFLNIELEDNTTLQEVVVTGMFTKAKESYTGAANMVTGKDLQLAGSQGVISSLRTIDPSFNLMDNNLLGSDPNNIENMQITMRGSTSLTDVQTDAQNAIQSNMPLFIIDMFEADLKTVVDLDENRIESITLLKDASATALYGSKGANGVIVITTKKPKEGKLRFSYKGTLSFQAPDLSSYDLMNAMEKLDFEKAAGLYSNETPSINEYLENLYNTRRMDAVRGVDTYWLAYPVQLGVGNKHSLSVEGGENAVRYAINLSYNQVVGAMKGSTRNTLNGEMYLSYTKDNLVFSNKLGVANNKAYNSPYGSFDKYAKMNSYYAPFDENGYPVQRLDKGEYYGLESSAGYTRNEASALNPLWDAYLPSRNDNGYLEITDNLMAEWHLIPKVLFLRGRFSFSKEISRSDVAVSAEHTKFLDYTAENFDRKGTYDYGTGYSDRYEGDLTLNYSNTFKELHQLFFGAGVTVSDESTESYTVRVEGLPIPALIDYFPTATQYEADGNPSGSESIRRGVKAYATANYTYDRRYFTDFSYTIEGNSQFGAEKRVAPFWSAGLGWNAHQEKFLQNHPVLNVFRLRASYGVTGSANFSAYQAMTMYKLINGSDYRGNAGVELMALGNPNLGWQKTGLTNVGTDIEILNNRIVAKIDVYNKITDNLLANRDVPLATGFASYRTNIGKVANRGVEAELKFNIIRNPEQGIYWSVGGNLVHNKNKILDISDELEAANQKLLGNITEDMTEEEKAAILERQRNPSYLYKEGESINTMFAVRSKGIDPATGKEIFIKLDGTETFEWDAADQVACGVTDAAIRGNLSTSFRYKGFTALVYFRYEFGGYAYNQTLVDKVENIYPYENADRRVLYDRWKEPGDITYFKSVTDFTKTKATSRFIMKNDIFQCSSATLRYDFPSAWAKKNLHVSNLSLQATMEDIFYTSTIKRERGTSYPFANKFAFSLLFTF
jgi:TonB-linked SusC/RagA family outer membrane protein